MKLLISVVIAISGWVGFSVAIGLMWGVSAGVVSFLSPFIAFGIFLCFLSCDGGCCSFLYVVGWLVAILVATITLIGAAIGSIVLGVIFGFLAMLIWIISMFAVIYFLNE